MLKYVGVFTFDWSVTMIDESEWQQARREEGMRGQQRKCERTGKAGVRGQRRKGEKTGKAGVRGQRRQG